MLRCSCGCEFYEDELEVVYETHGLPTPPYEKFLVCPNCGYTDYEEIYEEAEEE